jgi:hypothetical protein
MVWHSVVIPLPCCRQKLVLDNLTGAAALLRSYAKGVRDYDLGSSGLAA